MRQIAMYEEWRSGIAATPATGPYSDRELYCPAAMDSDSNEKVELASLIRRSRLTAITRRIVIRRHQQSPNRSLGMVQRRGSMRITGQSSGSSQTIRTEQNPGKKLEFS